MAHTSGRVLVMLAVGMLFAAVAVSADEAGAVDAPEINAFDLPGGVDVASFRDGRIRELEERLAARKASADAMPSPPSAGVDDEQAARFDELRAEHRRRLERLMEEGNVPQPGGALGDDGLPGNRNLAAGDDTFENVDFEALRARHEEIMASHRTTMENFRAEHAQFLSEHAERMKELRETLDRELPGGYNGDL